MSFKKPLYQILAKFGINLFTKIFPEYFAQEPLAPSDRYLEYSFVIRNLPKPPAKILDVGCSGSFFPLILASFGYNTYGVDIRNYPILNKLKFNNFTFIKEDIRKTSFADKFFDVVTVISTIEHIGLSGRYGMAEDSKGDKKAIKEIKRILKPKGILLLTVPFGKAKIIKPYHKIYDRNLIKRLIKDLKVKKEEYYLQDAEGNWYQCSKRKAGSTKATRDKSALCLLKAVKDEKNRLET